jgi:CO/xanthine dehydrogenase Mo-binding subunit
MRFTSGVMLDGRITARRIEIRFDTGAYADQGPRVVRQAGYRAPGPYRIPNLEVDAWAVYTNKVPAGAYRGFGASQPIYACESHMDEIAAGLGLDPLELRRRNLLGPGEDFVPGDLPVTCDLPEALRLAAAEMARPARSERFGGDRRRRGVGFAVGLKNTASGNTPSAAIVRLHADGSATLLVSSVEIGQGTLTMLSMVVGETLGIDPARVRVTTPDTAVTPFDERTSSSRMTVHAGLAAQRAAEDAARLAVEAAGLILGCPPDGLRLSGGAILGGPRPLSIGALVRSPAAGFGGEVIGVGHFIPVTPDAPTSLGIRTGYWEGTVGAADVAVDVETGEVEVVRYVIVSDVGRIINPLTAHGQEEGGAVMAFGHALFEASLFEDGAFLNPTLVDYRVPRTSDVPADLVVRAIERGDGPGPFGSKGMGETSIITVAPAIANAVAAATGVRFRELPLNSWTVWRALRGAAPPAGS